MKNVRFVCQDYRAICLVEGAVVYADPPYALTTEYAHSCFDSKGFWREMEKWAEAGAEVFVSEYMAPSGWKAVWSCERTRDMKAHLTDAVRVTERLFVRADKKC